MEPSENTRNKVSHLSRSDQASNTPFEMAVFASPAKLSNSNEQSDSACLDEARNYTPEEVLEWETQILTTQEYEKYLEQQVLDEGEEHKSKSTLDSTENPSSLGACGKAAETSVQKKHWLSPVIVNVDRFENPISKNVLICDMYLKVKTGGSRTLDKVYAQSKAYFKYLRYGLTFLEHYDESDPEICLKVELVRKGLMRVFELKIDYLLNDLDSFDETTKILSQKDCNVRAYVIGEAYKHLASSQISEKADSGNNFVELIHYVQTDGINVQISWCESLQCWSIGSYNVSILAKSMEDVKKYPGFGKKLSEMEKHEVRFNYCHLIASEWFKITDQISQTDTLTLSDLQADLKDCTLVGELVGNENFQQILNYPKCSLIFSSLIANSSPGETCLPPEKLAALCEKWSLAMIPINSVGLFQTESDLKEAMLELYNKVTSGPICKFEEGAVMMLVARSQEPGTSSTTLSCSKIKTIEYKVLKKLKDKLKHFWDQYETATFITAKMEKEYKGRYDRFKSEINEIFKSHHPFDVFAKGAKKTKEEVKEYANAYTHVLVKNKEFYFKFAKTAFDSVMYDVNLYKTMKCNFSQFCHEVLAQMDTEKNVSFKSEIFDHDSKYIFDHSKIV